MRSCFSVDCRRGAHHHSYWGQSCCYLPQYLFQILKWREIDRKGTGHAIRAIWHMTDREHGSGEKKKGERAAMDEKQFWKKKKGERAAMERERNQSREMQCINKVLIKHFNCIQNPVWRPNLSIHQPISTKFTKVWTLPLSRCSGTPYVSQVYLLISFFLFDSVM